MYSGYPGRRAWVTGDLRRVLFLSDKALHAWRLKMESNTARYDPWTKVCFLNVALAALLTQATIMWNAGCDSVGPGEATSTTWYEAWDNAEPGTYMPSACDIASDCTFIAGDASSWFLGDTASNDDECEPDLNMAEVISEQGSQRLRLTVGQPYYDDGCRDDIFIGAVDPYPSVALAPNTHISFHENGEMINPQPHSGVLGSGSLCGLPPCGDKTYLKLVDNHDRSLLYILQRSERDQPFPAGIKPIVIGLLAGTYHEIFLDPDETFYERNLFDDFSQIEGFDGVNARITGVGFEMNGAGSCTIDDILITER